MTDYSIVTEYPDTYVTREQLARAYTRYKFAQQYCAGKDVLELACGGGQGLGILAAVAKSVIGSDINEKPLQEIRKTYKEYPNISVKKINAMGTGLPDSALDVVIIFEAIYYLPDINGFLSECWRVLRSGGVLIICSANKEWKDFNPSPYSVSYYSAREIFGFLQKAGFKTELFCSDMLPEKSGLVVQLVSLIKRAAVRLHIIPRSMRFKKYLKRIFIGKLFKMPYIITDNMTEYLSPHSINPRSYLSQFKVLYAVGSITK